MQGGSSGFIVEPREERVHDVANPENDAESLGADEIENDNGSTYQNPFPLESSSQLSFGDIQEFEDRFDEDETVDSIDDSMNMNEEQDNNQSMFSLRQRRRAINSK